ncbi:MAG: tRNA-dihydrouridine synthase [Oligoflexales bacterium]|nr:tRNA-dihydrouridine synthase [Oligoflexales bacterium]
MRDLRSFSKIFLYNSRIDFRKSINGLVQIVKYELELNPLEEGLLFTEALENSGADWLTIHARSSVNKHSGAADWGAVGEITQRRSIPIIANGDIQNASDALQILQRGYADGAMIGRAITARPWLLAQIAWLLKEAEPELYDYQFEVRPPTCRGIFPMNDENWRFLDRP